MFDWNTGTSSSERAIRIAPKAYRCPCPTLALGQRLVLFCSRIYLGETMSAINSCLDSDQLLGRSRGCLREHCGIVGRCDKYLTLYDEFKFFRITLTRHLGFQTSLAMGPSLVCRAANLIVGNGEKSGMARTAFDFAVGDQKISTGHMHL